MDADHGSKFVMRRNLVDASDAKSFAQQPRAGFTSTWIGNYHLPLRTLDTMEDTAS